MWSHSREVDALRGEGCAARRSTRRAAGDKSCRLKSRAADRRCQWQVRMNGTRRQCLHTENLPAECKRQRQRLAHST
eukprot:8982332-Heterocapsa_arctica.AAC.1